jgi:hypothetical protein
LFTPEVELGVLDVFSRVSSKSVLLFPTDVFRKNESEKVGKRVKSNQKALQCDFCDHWTHLRCTTITVKEYHILAKCDDQYFCHFCYDRLPTFSDSFFLNTSVGNNNTDFDETLKNTSNTPNSTSTQLRFDDKENVYNFIRQKFFDFIKLITIAIDVYVGC